MLLSNTEKRRDRAKLAYHKRLLAGKALGKIPMGYKIIKIKPRTKNNSGKEIIVCEKTSIIIIDIFQSYATGNFTLRTLYEHIQEKHNLLKSLSSLQHLLRNKFYIGFINCKGKEYPHRYPTFISKELFDQVQSILKEKNNKYFKTKENKKCLLVNEKNINEKVKGRLHRVEQGYYPSHLPFGYKRLKKFNIKKSYGDLLPVVLDEFKVKIIRDVFEKYSTGEYTYCTLYSYLKKTYNLNFHSRFVSTALSNKFYIGIMSFKGKEYPHKYDKIIENDLFNKCQSIKIKNSQKMRNNLTKQD